MSFPARFHVQGLMEAVPIAGLLVATEEKLIFPDGLPETKVRVPEAPGAQFPAVAKEVLDAVVVVTTNVQELFV